MDIVENDFNAIKTLTVTDFLKVKGINHKRFAKSPKPLRPLQN